MSRLTLIRHGHAAAGWGVEPDPGLDDTGRLQAREVANVIAPQGPLPLVCSPLRRARETAEPLEGAWGRPARIESGVGEIVSPTPDLARRSGWLAAVMAGQWSDQVAPLQKWRSQVIRVLLALEEDTIVITHFVVINVAVGAATGDGRVACSAPGNCSRTEIEVAGGALHLVSLGAEAETVVN